MVADRRHNLTVGGCTAKRAWPDRVVGSSPLQREEGRCISLSLSLTLTPHQLKNGYISIASNAKDFFEQLLSLSRKLKDEYVGTISASYDITVQKRP